MASENVSNVDTKEINSEKAERKESETEPVNEVSSPLPSKMDDDKQAEDTASSSKEPANEEKQAEDTASSSKEPPNEETCESGAERGIDAAQSSDNDANNENEHFVRVSSTSVCESLCSRILEDWSDEEDLLPPVVDFSVEQMCPGWYRNLCASPDCHGDL